MNKPLATIAPEAPAPDAATAIIQVIERAAMNPAVDIDKMERLLQMQERVMERNARAAYAAALSELQPQLPVVTERGGIKDKGGNIQSTYARWEDINDAIRPILAAHGFALSFRTGQEGGQMVVTGVLSHREGHSEQTTMHLPLDGSGSKNAVQAVGSSLSYGKRYTALALLNITSRGEDDDGRAAGTLFVDDGQARQIDKLIVDVGANREAFLNYMGAAAVEQIKAKDFRKAVAALNAKRSQAR